MFGLAPHDWQFRPADNAAAAKVARETMRAHNIQGTLVEVAPWLFWVQHEGEKHCHEYDGGIFEGGRQVGRTAQEAVAGLRAVYGS